MDPSETFFEPVSKALGGEMWDRYEAMIDSPVCLETIQQGTNKKRNSPYPPTWAGWEVCPALSLSLALFCLVPYYLPEVHPTVSFR